MKFLSFIAFFLIFLIQPAYGQYHIIPQPSEIEIKQTKSNINRVINISSPSKELKFEAEYLGKLLESKGYTIKLNLGQKVKSASGKEMAINLVLNTKPNLKQEAYELRFFAGTMNLSSSSNAGIFRGIQTCDQMLPYFVEHTKVADCVIRDEPRFDWRGLMLDVSRHFFTVEEVKTYIDMMARYKFSVFHWHLTDDEGWRIQIKSLPKLTEVGAWRAERTGRFGTREMPNKDEPTTYGGFYTQEQIKDVVAYAKQRHITIVPEIEMPGHSMAILAAYPKLSTLKEDKFVSCGFKFADWPDNGKFVMLVENTLNPSDEKVYETLEKIIGEVAALFPGEYFHVGGDEAYHGFWERSEDCQKFMKKNNLNNTLELQSYFMKRIEKIVSSKGKKMIGWDEILYGGLADGAAVMSWRGMDGGIEAAKMGHKVVMSPTNFVYLDYTQSDHSLELPIYADLTLKKVYDFDPLPTGIDSKLILGGQGNLWTEHIPNLSHAFYMTYPRAFAIIESLWTSPGDKNWSTFSKKVDYHFSLFDRQGIDICKAVYDPFINMFYDGDKLMCELKCETPGVDIYYTIDNTFPNVKSNKYKMPFEIPNTQILLRVNTFKEGKPLGRMLNLSREVLAKRAKK